jgi:Skp family chaperone for outer membrane proteins
MTGRVLAILGGGAICFLLGGFLPGMPQATNVQRSFAPPRLAVVDISAIFENYEKKADRQAQLRGDTEALEAKLKELEKKYKELLEELPHLEPGEKLTEKQIEKLKLELDVKELKGRELKKIREKYVEFLKELREEIKQEIEVYARAQDLDLVVEKNVTAEGEGNTPVIPWSIVHFAKPELDITVEITERLNARYKRK